MALTATANLHTRQKVLKALEMNKCYVVTEMPNNPSVFLAVIPKPDDHTKVVQPIVDQVCTNGASADRYLVFCRTYGETVEMFQEAALQLDARNSLYVTSGTVPKHERRTCEKYDACTADNIKHHVVQSFTDPSGVVRVVFATIAFAMGLDSPNIRNILHWGPPRDTETYLQEIGRAARDGKPAVAVLFYKSTDFRGNPGVTEAMRTFCTNTVVCRRKLLMEGFGSTDAIIFPETKCQCCDVCASDCACQFCQLPEAYLHYQMLNLEELLNFDQADEESSRGVPLSPKQTALKSRLLAYRRHLCEKILLPETDATVMVGIEISTGITDQMIDLIVKHSSDLQSKDDLTEICVESCEHIEMFWEILTSTMHQ